MDHLAEVLSHLNFFLTIVFADLVAIFLWWIVKGSAETNVWFHNRVRSVRFNCMAILYQEARNARLQGVSEDELQAMMKTKYENKSFPFMLNDVSSPKYIDAIAFVGNAINNKEVLLSLSRMLSFGFKEYKGLCKILGEEEKVTAARNAVCSILIDKSKHSVDCAMIWLPKLLTTILVDPDEPRKVGVVENTYTLFYLFKGIYFEDVTVKEYQNVLEILRKAYPIKVSFSGHSSDWSIVTLDSYPRGRLLSEEIRGVLNG